MQKTRTASFFHPLRIAAMFVHRWLYQVKRRLFMYPVQNNRNARRRAAAARCVRLSLEDLEERLNLSSLPPVIPYASPNITTTQQPASAPVGTSIADQASISGVANPNASDTVTFNLYSSGTTQDSTTL